MASKILLAIHGGAGIGDVSDEHQKQLHKSIEMILTTSMEVLKTKTAVDAVEMAVQMLENDPLYNAGKGAVFTRERTHEMDASIMDGKTMKCGSCAGIKTVKNPISLARCIMEKTPHIMMIGDGAELLAKQNGLEIVENSHFDTEYRLEQLLNAQKSSKMGTVGAVALDRFGNVAAATSTGGMTNKLCGRVGDSPIIGAGTYANRNVAISCTGHGEQFIRNVVAYDLACIMEYKEVDLKKASELEIQKMKKNDVKGGYVAVSKEGEVVMPFNTSGMARGWITESQIHTAIYPSEEGNIKSIAQKQ